MNVYVMQAENNIYKIGYSQQVETRVSAMQTSSPLLLKLLMSICLPSDRIAHAIERALHKQFANKRIHGEWFQLNNIDLQCIELVFAILTAAYKTTDQSTDDTPKISAKEKEKLLLTLVSEGKTNQEIGTILLLSPNYVRNVLSRLYKKYKVHNRTELVYVLNQSTTNVN